MDKLLSARVRSGSGEPSGDECSCFLMRLEETNFYFWVGQINTNYKFAIFVLFIALFALGLVEEMDRAKALYLNEILIFDFFEIERFWL